jgi:hypothetical protein
MCAAKMIGAVYRSWFSNVDALKKHFGVKDGLAMTPEECSVMADNIQVPYLKGLVPLSIYI